MNDKFRIGYAREGACVFTGQLLLQMIVILLVVQLFGQLGRRIGLLWVIGEILAGLALGPSLLGALWPALETSLFPAKSLPVLQTFGDIGLILYMFSLGSRLETKLMLRQSRKALFVSLCSIFVPLALGVLLGVWLYPGLAGAKATFFPFVLLVGTAMALTAFPVLARLLTEKKMLGTDIGMLALTCASVVDVIAWCLLAYVLSVAHGEGSLSVITTVALTILFTAGMLFGMRPLLNFVMRRIQAQSLQMALSLVFLLISAYITSAIGVHPVFGAFLAGICLPRNVAFTTHVRSIDQVNEVLFLPLFFVYSGLQTRIGLIQGIGLWSICLLILLTACVGKISGGTFATRLIGKSWRESLTIGVLVNTRGLVELIILNIGLQAGILSPTLFAMLVIMAIVTTMIASPLLPLLGYRSVPVKTGQAEPNEPAISPE